jgi:hypothetical protein
MVWTVVYLPAAEGERGKLPGNERAAPHNAVRKLEEIGPDLPYPHSSDAATAALLARRKISRWSAEYTATVRTTNAVALITRSVTALLTECGHWNPGSQLWEPMSSDSPGLTTTSRGRICRGSLPARLPQTVPDTGFVPGGQGVAGSNPAVPTIA